MALSHVILRQTRDAEGLRFLEASLTSNGDLLVEGQDLGDGVEQYFGVREYEWKWTIPAASLPALLRALGASGDVLAALRDRFSGDDAASLGSFLETHGIATERWSRLGD